MIYKTEREAGWLANYIEQIKDMAKIFGKYLKVKKRRSG